MTPPNNILEDEADGAAWKGYLVIDQEIIGIYLRPRHVIDSSGGGNQSCAVEDDRPEGRVSVRYSVPGRQKLLHAVE